MYYLIYGLLYLLSLLPLRVLFVLSDFFYVIIYYVAGYRKEVVFKNLDIAFPEKSPTQKKKIAKQFYKNLIDNFIETIKLISANEKFIKRHYYGDMTPFFDVYATGKKCQAHLGHNFNWEYANIAMPLYTPYKLVTVYMPINNKAMDRLFIKLRSKTGAKLVAATRMSREIIPYRSEQYLLALVADQNPGVPSKAYWLNFFGRPTPFVKGPEKGAKANDSGVVFCHFTKPKRGYYEAHFELATLEPNSFEEGQLTKKYIDHLEKVIKENPEMWLWSHRRWKHEWKPEYGEIIG